jgi:hypothetical protein
MRCIDGCEFMVYTSPSFYCEYYDKWLVYKSYKGKLVEVTRCYECISDSNKRRMDELQGYINSLLYNFKKYSEKLDKDINNINKLYNIIRKTSNEEKENVSF